MALEEDTYARFHETEQIGYFRHELNNRNIIKQKSKIKKLVFGTVDHKVVYKAPSHDNPIYQKAPFTPKFLVLITMNAKHVPCILWYVNASIKAPSPSFYLDMEGWTCRRSPRSSRWRQMLSILLLIVVLNHCRKSRAMGIKVRQILRPGTPARPCPTMRMHSTLRYYRSRMQ